MKLGFSQQQIIDTAKTLGLPTDGFIQRRVARAFDILESDKVTEVTDGIFRVHSQYDEGKSYIVNLNHGEPSCDCPDGERTINCKHRIAALLFSQKHAQMLTIYDDTANSYLGRGRWIVTDHKARIKYIIYRDKDGRLHCPCNPRNRDCEHKKAIREYLNNGGGNGGKRIVNECGSNEAKQLQNKLNGQLDSQNDNGNGAKQAPSQQLDISDPFQQCEQLDIDQIEGRSNGELVHKLSNGEYVISYKGIMTLSEKHGIEFSEAIHSDTSTVIAKGRCGTSERVSGKPINGNANTAIELAKRNAARQLLPYAELRAVQKKAQLEADFSWERAKAKCLELVTDFNLDILIHELVQANKLRMDSLSGYSRTEWLLIHKACEKDAQIERDPKSLNRWSYNSAGFISKCREAIQKVRDAKSVEANEQPLEGGNGKRKLQMDSKLRTWLIEADGTRKAISCREIAMQFDSYEKGIIKQLRTGIECGADISTVELDD